jgi:hypothetical protein
MNESVGLPPGPAHHPEDAGCLPHPGEAYTYALREKEAVWLQSSGS